MTTITLTKREHSYLVRILDKLTGLNPSSISWSLAIAEAEEKEMKARRNPHRGSSLKSLLQEDGTYKGVKSKAKTRAAAENRKP